MRVFWYTIEACKHAMDYGAVSVDTLFGAADNKVLAGLLYVPPERDAVVIATGPAQALSSPAVNGAVAFPEALTAKLDVRRIRDHPLVPANTPVDDRVLDVQTRKLGELPKPIPAGSAT